MKTKILILSMLFFSYFNLFSQNFSANLTNSYKTTEITVNENEINDFAFAILTNTKSSYKKFINKYPKSIFNEIVVNLKNFKERKYRKEKKIMFYTSKYKKQRIGKKNKESNLIGVSSRVYFEPTPYNMVFIPQGTFKMGETNESEYIQTKIISIDPFWMDEAEVSNLQYREFINWVRDSIALRLCVKNGLEQYKAKINIENSDPELYDHSDPNQCYLNFEKRNEIWTTNDEDTKIVIRDLYFKKGKVIDKRQLNYEYYWVDLSMSKKNYNFDSTYTELTNRLSFIKHTKINIYPDTLVWQKDFNENYNEPFTNYYFWHKAFSFYPVVGVTWKQAKAFCIWKTNMINSKIRKKEAYFVQDFRLPTEAEWEYAVRAGLVSTQYTWGNSEPENLCNYFGSNNTFISQAKSYEPNVWGLYGLAGNVAEYTSSYYQESDSTIVVRGGSWCHDEYFLQNGARAYFHQDSAASYVGFRCVRSYSKDWNWDNNTYY